MSDAQGKSAEYQLGKFDGRISAVENDVRRLEKLIDTRLNSMDTKLSVVHDAVTSAGGSWKAIAVLGTIVAVLGGLLAGFLQWIGHK